jgi:uncharacterized protein (TIGR03067 family)
MKTRLAAVVLLGAAFAAVGVAAGGDAKKDLKRFEGTWAIESGTKAGMALPAEEVEKVRLTFAGNKVTQRMGDKEEEGSFKIDPGKKPRQIDVTMKGKTYAGIYAFEKGKLKICITDEGGERPTKFESPEGSKTAVVVLKRVKS